MPVRLMVLALLTGCGGEATVPLTAGIAADSADQVMEGMTTNILGGGVRRSLIQADTAYMYQSRQIIDMRGLRANFFDQQGAQVSILTARTGIYEVARGTLEARGSVVVTSTDGTGKRLATEHLVYDPNMNQIRSDSAFTYQSPTGILSGQSFYSDPEFRNVVTSSPRGRQRGQGILLPGQ